MNFRPSAIANTRYFKSDPVGELTDDDFDLKSNYPIALKYNDCIIVLFYAQNEESYKVMDVFFNAASATPLRKFYACDLVRNRGVARAFQLTAEKGFTEYSLKGVPTIMVYRDGYPRAFFNGSINTAAISDWTMTLACEPGYMEPTQLARGVTLNPGQNIEAPAPRLAGPARTSSTQFTGDQSMRGTQYELPLRVVNSAGPAGPAAESEVTRVPAVRALPSQRVVSNIPTPAAVPAQPVGPPVAFPASQSPTNQSIAVPERL